MNKQINIKEIPKDPKYTGYLWLSDSKTPKEYHNPSDISEFLKDFADENNPFIIEGQLYCKEGKKSYSIKYVDGKHIVVEYDLKEIPDNWVKDEKKYLSNRIAGVSKLIFEQYWKPEPDEFCQGMMVLQPAALVFVGFEYESKEVKEEK